MKACSNAGVPTSQPGVPQGLGTLPNGQLAGDPSTSGAAESGGSQGWFGSWFGGGDSSASKVQRCSIMGLLS